MNDIIVRDYMPYDEYEIVDLLNIVHPALPRSLSYWRWSNTDCYNKDFVSVVLVDKNVDKIVGHYSIMSRLLAYKGDFYPIGFCQQAIIHPTYRNFKNVISLCEYAFLKAKEKYKLLFAFPNNNIYPIYLKFFHWEEIEAFKADTILLDEIEIEDKSSFSVKRLYSFGNDTLITKDLLGDVDGFFLYKDSNFLEWRFFQNPVNNYMVLGAFSEEVSKLQGYLVVKFYENPYTREIIAHFIDYAACDCSINILQSLIIETKKILLFYNIKEVVFWNKSNQVFRDFFSKFSHNNCKECFVTNMGFYLLDDIGINQDYLGHIKNWNFTMADSDAF